MSFREVLELFVRADVEGAVRNVHTLGDAAERELGQKAISATDRWANRMVYAGAGLVGVAAVTGAGLYRLSQDAVSLGETINKNSEVFGRNAAAIEQWADGADRDFGQSKQQALAAAASFGNMFQQLDMGLGPATRMSKGMVELASDFASFHDADITEVLAAQEAAFRGEYDAVQRFVPVINAAAVEQRALADTGKTSNAELTAGEKAAAAYALMVEGAGKAVGDFDRTNDSAANKQRILNAEWANMRAELGAGVIPVLSKAIDVGTGAIDMFQGLNDATGGSLGTFATYGTVASGAAGGLLLVAGGALKARDTLSQLTTSFGSAGSASAGFIRALPTVGILAGVTFGVVQLAEALVEANRATADVDVSADALANRSDKVNRQLKDLSAELRSLTADADGFQGGFVAMREKTEDYEDTVADLIEKVKTLAGESPTLAQEFIAQAEAAGLPRDVLRELNKVVEDQVRTTKTLADAKRQDVDLTNEQADATAQAAEAILRQIDATEQSFSTELRAQRATQDLTAAQNDYNEKVRIATEAGGNNELANAAVALSQQELTEKVLASAAANEAHAVKMAEAAGAADAADQGNKAFRDTLVFLAGTMAPGSPTRVHLEGLIGRLDEAGKNRHATVTANGQQAVDEADRVARAWENAGDRIRGAMGSASNAVAAIGRTIGETYGGP